MPEFYIFTPATDTDKLLTSGNDVGSFSAKFLPLSERRIKRFLTGKYSNGWTPGSELAENDSHKGSGQEGSVVVKLETDVTQAPLISHGPCVVQGLCHPQRNALFRAVRKPLGST